MKRTLLKAVILSVAMVGSMAMFCVAAVKVDDEVFGNSLGGWKKRDHQAAEYPLSGATYRTYKPEVTPTPDGGIFVSVRIDHVRNWLASDDHATLEMSFSPKGLIVSAQSNIALQGLSVTSDLILGANEAGRQLTGGEHAAQIGADLVANLSAKMLQQNIVEAGRVSYPAVVRHNYNLLFQALRLDGMPLPPTATPPPAIQPAVAIPIPVPPAPPVIPPPAVVPPVVVPPAPAPPTAAPGTTPPVTPVPSTPPAPPQGYPPLEVKPYQPQL